MIILAYLMGIAVILLILLIIQQCALTTLIWYNLFRSAKDMEVNPFTFAPTSSSERKREKKREDVARKERSQVGVVEP